MNKGVSSFYVFSCRRRANTMWVDKKTITESFFVLCYSSLKENVGIGFLLTLVAELGVYLPQLWKGVSMFPFRVDSICSGNAVHLTRLQPSTLSLTGKLHAHVKTHTYWLNHAYPHTLSPLPPDSWHRSFGCTQCAFSALVTLPTRGNTFRLLCY